MHDGAYFEGQGIVCAVLISDAFKSQAQYQAQSLGYDDAARVFVKHPVSDQTEAQLYSKADQVFADTIIALTSNDVANVSQGTEPRAMGSCGPNG